MEKVGESWRGGVPLPGRIPFGGKGVLPEKGGPSRSRNPFTSLLDICSLKRMVPKRGRQTSFADRLWLLAILNEVCRT